MLENLDLPVAKAAEALTTADMSTVQDMLAREKDKLKKRTEAFEALMLRKFGDAAADAYKDAGKDTGVVRTSAPGSNLLELKVECDKTVVWDQDKLLKVLNGMTPENARHYGKLKVEVAEAKFVAAPPDVAKLLAPLRTVKPGKLKFTLVQREDEAEAA